MTIYITAVHMEPSNAASHQHIAEVKWMDTSDGDRNRSSRASMVKWINDGNRAWVRDGRGQVQVGVVDGSPPYLRTYADSRFTDNLLALPRY